MSPNWQVLLVVVLILSVMVIVVAGYIGRSRDTQSASHNVAPNRAFSRVAQKVPFVGPISKKDTEMPVLRIVERHWRGECHGCMVDSRQASAWMATRRQQMDKMFPFAQRAYIPPVVGGDRVDAHIKALDDAWERGDTPYALIMETGLTPRHMPLGFDKKMVVDHTSPGDKKTAFAALTSLLTAWHQWDVVVINETGATKMIDSSGLPGDGECKGDDPVSPLVTRAHHMWPPLAYAVSREYIPYLRSALTTAVDERRLTLQQLEVPVSSTEAAELVWSTARSVWIHKQMEDRWFAFAPTPV